MSEANKGFFYRPFYQPPSKKVFAERALRFEELAEADESPWGAYLALLATLCHVQQSGYERLLASGEAAPQSLPLADGSHIPAAFVEVLQALLTEMSGKVPSVAQQALDKLAAASDEELATWAAAALRTDEAAQDTTIWLRAAAQIIWSAWATPLDDDRVAREEGSAACPCCGSEAVVSMVYAQGDLTHLCYLHCPMCNSRWNALRAKCTFCGEQSAISLQQIEDSALPALKGARAESCDVCQSYRKMHLLEVQQYADPIADDLASLALDILMGEAGYQRGGRNPYLL